MESRVKSSTEKPSDIRRDSCSGSSELLVRSTWSQVWEEDKAKQKQREPTYPVFGLHMEWEGDDKKKKKRDVGKNNKEKEWTDANLRATWKQSNIYGVWNMFAIKWEWRKENIKEMWEVTAMETAGWGMEGGWADWRERGSDGGGERVSQPWTAAGVPRTFNLLTHQTSCVVGISHLYKKMSQSTKQCGNSRGWEDVGGHLLLLQLSVLLCRAAQGPHS